PDCQSDLPVARSRHRTVRRFSASTAWVRKIRLPQTIGVELPPSGSAVFQMIFFESVHSVGRFLSGDTPFPSGPRHAGQFAANAREVKRGKSGNDSRRVTFMSQELARANQNRRLFFGRLPTNEATFESKFFPLAGKRLMWNVPSL